MTTSFDLRQPGSLLPATAAERRRDSEWVCRPPLTPSATPCPRPSEPGPLEASSAGPLSATLARRPLSPT